MDTKKIDFNYFYWGPFLYKTKITDEEVKTLLNLSFRHRGEKDARESLAGHLKDEYFLPTDKVMQVLHPYFNSYVKAYLEIWGSNFKGVLEGGIKMTQAWANFMKKGEYNPPHIHFSDDGVCALSCVTYLKIPEDMPGEKEFNGPGSILFQHGHHARQSINTHTFVPEVGDFFIFPGSLQHSVAPFQCDGERISLSANLIEINNAKKI